MSPPKCLFIFYNSFSLRLTENLHEQKTFSQNMIYMFCLYNFFVKCIIKKIVYLHTSPVERRMQLLPRPHLRGAHIKLST